MPTIRGHTILCLQGFRGKGYSQDFIANMSNIHKTLINNPDTEVRVVTYPDDICLGCPHLKDMACVIDGKKSEEEMRALDERVIGILGLSPGLAYRWKDILDRISRRITLEMFDVLCRDCRWFELGSCKDGIRRLTTLR